jgi:hypothetical protein
MSGLGNGFCALRPERRRRGKRLTARAAVAFIGAVGSSAEKKKLQGWLCGATREGAVLRCHAEEKGGGVRPDQRTTRGR